MKNLGLVLVLMLTTALTGAAQNANSSSATITLSGNVAPFVDVRVASVTGASSGTSVGTLNPTFVSVNLNNLSPGRPTQTTNGHVAFNVNLHLRGNAAFTLSGMAGGLSGGTDDSSLQLIDVGFSVRQVSRTGTNASSAAVTTANTDIAANGLNINPTDNPLVNGYPNYSKTLNDFTTMKELFNSTLITLAGDINSTDNAMNVPLRFVIAPQYYDPTTNFTGTFQVSIATP